MADSPQQKSLWLTKSKKVLRHNVGERLTKPKHNEGYTEDDVGSLGESLNPMGKLRVPTHPFP